MSGPSSAPAPSLLRQPDFARLWTAETVSQLGTQVSALAIPFVAIDILRASTFEVALLNVVDFLPFLLIDWGTIPIGGVLGGVLGSVLGVRAALLVGIVGEILAVLPVLFSRVRGIRAMPAPPAEEIDPRPAGADAGGGPAS